MSNLKRDRVERRGVKPPSVLLVSAFRWISLARAAIAFHEAGFAVSALVPSGHPVEKLSFITSTYAFNVFAAEKSIVEAVRQSQSELLVPFDDVVVPLLHELHFKLGAKSKIGALISLSLGQPEFFPVTLSRLLFADRLLALSISSPRTLPVKAREDLPKAERELGLPTVLKRDGSWGGQGVAIVQSQEELHAAFAKLSLRGDILRAVKRAIFNRDLTLLQSIFCRPVKSVVAQEFLPGRPANAAVACWQGEVLGSVNLEVLQSAGVTGPATVVRMIDSPTMTKAIKAVVKDLKLSGICGFDFILRGAENQPQMIEMNPRSVPTLHLIDNAGNRLCQLLYDKLTGVAGPVSLASPQRGVIALFPQEFLRDPDSPYLSNSFHDIPTKWPEYIELATGKKAMRRHTKLGEPRKI